VKIATRIGLLIGCFLALGTAGAAPSESVLEFANGDAVAGALEPGEGDLIRWRSKWFEAPLEIDPVFLKRLTLERVPALTAPASFRALLRNGDVVHGDLARIGPGFIELESPRHGIARLQTASMRSLNRLDNPALRYSGPVSVEGWLQSGPGREESYWDGVPGGGISTRRWGAGLFHRFELPDRVAIEVKVTSSRRPEFSVALQAFRGDVLRLETWDNELVLVEGTSDFQRLATLAPGERSVHLHLFWDQPAKSLTIFDASGRVLGTRQVTTGPDFAVNSGFALRNKGLDLELARLRVAEWRGDRPELQLIEGERIQRIDGSALREKAIGYDIAGRALMLEGGKVVPLADLETMVFDERAMELDARHTVQLTYADGTRISGNLVRTGGDSVVVKTGYSEAPLDLYLCRPDGIGICPSPRTGGDGCAGRIAGERGRPPWNPCGSPARRKDFLAPLGWLKRGGTACRNGCRCRPPEGTRTDPSCGGSSLPGQPGNSRLPRGIDPGRRGFLFQPVDQVDAIAGGASTERSSSASRRSVFPGSMIRRGQPLETGASGNELNPPGWSSGEGPTVIREFSAPTRSTSPWSGKAMDKARSPSDFSPLPVRHLPRPSRSASAGGETGFQGGGESARRKSHDRWR